VARVLVTGGTGTLGRPLVARLAARGHEVRSLSRHPAVASAGVDVPGVTQVGGDVRRGEGLAEAMADRDVVIHAATSPRMARAVELTGTANVVATAAETSAHVIYVSIVGVDTMTFAYYRAKDDAETVVESGPAPWTIQRATQFHDLIDRFLGWKIFPATAHMAFQPVDVAEVSERLVDLVEAGPSGRAEDFGGPAVVPVRQLAATRRRLAGSAALLLPVPAVGILKGFDQGRHLCPDHARGQLTWEQWLQRRAASSG
jgi:uncharacterized protein YbjT (DUF2867 family)